MINFAAGRRSWKSTRDHAGTTGSQQGAGAERPCLGRLHRRDGARGRYLLQPRSRVSRFRAMTSSACWKRLMRGGAQEDFNEAARVCKVSKLGRARLPRLASTCVESRGAVPDSLELGSGGRDCRYRSSDGGMAIELVDRRAAGRFHTGHSPGTRLKARTGRRLATNTHDVSRWDRIGLDTRACRVFPAPRMSWITADARTTPGRCGS